MLKIAISDRFHIQFHLYSVVPQNERRKRAQAVAVRQKKLQSRIFETVYRLKD